MIDNLVTGATGFLGSVLVRQLVDAGESVRILRRSRSKLDLLGTYADRVEHFEGDVTEPDSLYEAMEGIRRVYHAAGYVGFGGKRHAEPLRRINVEGTAHVVNAALEMNVERLVHTSSVAALGRSDTPPPMIDETARWQTARVNTAYAVSKYQAELEIHRGIAEGLDAVIVNPAVIFGVGRPGENTMAIVDKVRRKRMPVVPVGATCVVDVEDVAHGHRRAMEVGRCGERYILAGENLPWRTIINILAEALDVAPPRFNLPPKLGLFLATVSEAVAGLLRIQPQVTRETVLISAKSYRYDNRKAVEELGCTFRPFRQTAERIAEAVLQRSSDKT